LSYFFVTDHTAAVRIAAALTVTTCKLALAAVSVSSPTVIGAAAKLFGN
jgi:hypothetical protein